MTLHVTNTLTGKKEVFAPQQAPAVKMYVCGLTPYDETHIGHARAYVAYDVMKRYFEHKGFRVQHIQNITDVDDRIIARAHERNMKPLDFAALMHAGAEEAWGKLRIRPPQKYPKVSEHIAGIIDMAQALIQKGHAYVGKDEHGQTVYFSVESDPDYGKLSHLNRDELLQGVRKDVAEGKRHPADFALWKASKPNEGVSWDSPWGKGRPGWRIECSVMAKSLLGDTIDVHGGGWDLIFPHHENELAQSESANDNPFVKYWLHVGFLTVEGEKMSKSLGNFTTLSAALAEWKPEALRLWFAGTHYRSQIDYSLVALGQAAKNIGRFVNMQAVAKHALRAARKDERPADPQFLDVVHKRATEFEAAMDDDFNTPKALAVLFDLTTDINKYAGDPHGPTLEKALASFNKLEQVFDIMPDAAPQGASDAPPLLDLLLELRTMARARKDFAASDRIRDRLLELGYVIEDAASGPRWRRKT